MTSLELLRRYGAERIVPVVLIAIGGGFLGAAVMAAANAVLATGRSGGSFGIGLLFLAGLVAMFACNRWSARVAVEIFEDVQLGVRAELASSLEAAPLRTVEELGSLRGQVIADLVFISNSVAQLVTSLQDVAFLLCMTLIMAYVSVKALVIWLLACAAMALWLTTGLKQLGRLQGAVSTRSGELHAGLEEYLDGFKQVKLDVRAGAALVDDIKAMTAELYRDQARGGVATYETFLVANAIFFVLGFGLAVFAPAGMIGVGPALGYEICILLALSLGPLTGLLQAVPTFSKTEASASAVVAVLDRLRVDQQDAAGTDGAPFDAIDLAGLEFAYADRDGEELGFVVGPIDLTLRRGELIFVTGGNGSGKTTLMKMLLGLYPAGGLVRWDGRDVGSDSPYYRGLFSAIFGGQHLFDRLYGLDVPHARVTRLLERFGIADVVGFDGIRFGNLELSSGQRMRLAMVVTLLENRPICVFDEWTANQDPETTRFYHETLLPELRAAGKTVIAVSHDDRFLDRADHLVRLDKGKMVLSQRGVAGSD